MSGGAFTESDLKTATEGSVQKNRLKTDVRHPSVEKPQTGRDVVYNFFRRATESWQLNGMPLGLSRNAAQFYCVVASHQAQQSAIGREADIYNLLFWNQHRETHGIGHIPDSDQAG